MQPELLALKKQLLQHCIALQQQRTETSRLAMLQAQESANEEKGTMGDKFESFREQMQIDRDMHARQFDENMQILNTLKKIDGEKAQNSAGLGALVLTDSQAFFISASLGQVALNNKNYIAVSGKSPMFLAMAGKKQNDTFSFRDKKYKIIQIV